MTERVVLITGGVRGLGLATARRMAADGDRVHLVYRSSEALARERAAEFGDDRVHRADVTDAEDVAALFAGIADREGRLDVLVHAVGEYTTASLAETTPADWRRMWTSNVESTVLVADAARPLLRASRGALLAFGVAGLDGLAGRTRTAAYAAAKSALLVFVRSFAREEGPHGVRANLVSPGVVPHEHAADDAFDDAWRARIPLGRTGTPDEVAEAARYLCSDDARYVTGVDLAVAGGWLA